MKFTSIILGALFISLVVMGGVQIASTGITNLGSNVTVSAVDTQYNETRALILNVQNSTQQSSIIVTILSNIPIISGAWKALSLLFSAGNLMTVSVGNILLYMGVPAGITDIIFTMILAAITLTILAIILTRGEEI